MRSKFIPSGSHARVEDVETLDRREPVVVGSSSQPTGSESAVWACPECGGAATAPGAFCTQCGGRVTQTKTSASAASASDPPAGDPGGSRASSTSASPSISVAMPQWGQVTRNGWWLLGGALLVSIGSLLPWSQASVDGIGAGSSQSGGGGNVVFIFLAVCTIAAAWPLLTGRLSKRRLLGATVTIAFLALFAITNWSDLNKLQQQAAGGGGLVSVSYSPGSGLLLYTSGVVALCVLIVRLWLSRRSAAPAAL